MMGLAGSTGARGWLPAGWGIVSVVDGVDVGLDPRNGLCRYGGVEAVETDDGIDC